MIKTNIVIKLLSKNVKMYRIYIVINSHCKELTL